jgi:hypothetical protein
MGENQNKKQIQKEKSEEKRSGEDEIGLRKRGE